MSQRFVFIARRAQLLADGAVLAVDVVGRVVGVVNGPARRANVARES